MSSSFVIATGYGRPGFDSRQGKDIFLYSTASRASKGRPYLSGLGTNKNKAMGPQPGPKPRMTVLAKTSSKLQFSSLLAGSNHVTGSFHCLLCFAQRNPLKLTVLASRNSISFFYMCREQRVLFLIKSTNQDKIGDKTCKISHRLQEPVS
jgi:hypothetical protein